MQIKPIRNDVDLEAALDRVDALWGAPSGTPERDELDVLTVLIEVYEDEHHPVPPGDPIEVIRYKMGELGLNQSALAERLGWHRGRVSEVLNGKRDLTLAMVRSLAATLGINAGLLVGERRSKEDVWFPLPAELAASLRARAAADEVSASDWLERLVALALGYRMGMPVATQSTASTAMLSEVRTSSKCSRGSARRTVSIVSPPGSYRFQDVA